jgi:ribosomal-protein-alanine N-acetyltransferase
MEKIPHHQDVYFAPPRLDPEAFSDWREGLPTLDGAQVTLRELRTADAACLLASVSSQVVSRFISPPPVTIDGFEKFVEWAHRERAAGRSVCFAIVPAGTDTPVGIFQLRSLDNNFTTSEWGCVLASEFWGTGIFMEGAERLVDFAFSVVGAHRLEARTALRNGRGNAALRKLGAVDECLLRRSFLRHGEYLDQLLWTILSEDWLESKAVWGSHGIH